MKLKISYSMLGVLLVTFLSVSGCSTPMFLSPENKQMVHKITVDKQVQTPPMYFFGDGEQIALFIPGGLIGGAIAGVAGESKGIKLQKFAENNHIYIAQIVRDEFIKQINKNTDLRVVDNTSADANLQIKIRKYGLSVPTAYSTKLTPVLSLEATMMRNNQIIWKNNFTLDPMFGGLPKYNSKDIENNPELLAQAFNLAVEKAVQRLVKRLQ